MFSVGARYISPAFPKILRRYDQVVEKIKEHRLFFSREDYEAAARLIAERSEVEPRIGFILGSGLGNLADEVENAAIIPYKEIPNWPGASVKGHAGRLVIGHFEGKPVMVMQGRAHFYEGHPMQAIGFPVRVMQVLGLDTLVVTNAAGGINPGFAAGDLMVLNDHINLLGMMGQNPLIGPNDERFGPRFPAFTHTYDAQLRKLAFSVAKREGITLREGVYICLSGPAFESPADIRMLRLWGADAVGMSTVPEVLVARHGGMRVLGISSITNVAVDSIESSEEPGHEEVLAMSDLIVPRLSALLRGILREMPETQNP